MTTSSPRILIVTGMSGAGRSTCLKVLEDLGFEAVDNLPIVLLRRLLLPERPFEQDLAVGVDTRTRGFDPAAILQIIDESAANEPDRARLLFFDCSDEVIQRRYSETRRRHPMAQDRTVSDGIARERRLLEDLRRRADHLFDTTDTSLNSLRDRVKTLFAKGSQDGLAISIMSFGFRHGLPREADLVLDVRFIRNPHYVSELKYQTGLDPAVASFIAEDPDFADFTGNLLALLEPLLPRYRREGKSYLTIAIGCTGGQHRSVFIAEWLKSALSEAGVMAMTGHREIEAGRVAVRPDD